MKTVTAIEIGEHSSIELYDREGGFLVGRLNKRNKSGLVDDEWAASARMNYPDYAIRVFNYTSQLKERKVFMNRSKEGSHVGNLLVTVRGCYVSFAVCSDNYAECDQAEIILDREQAKIMLKKVLAELETDNE